MKKLKNTLALALIVSASLASLPGRAAAGEEPALVATDVAGDGAITGDASTGPLGFDLIAAYIHQPDFDKPAVEFIFQTTSDWSVPVAPEIVRFLWQINVNNVEYWIQAKTSDVTTAPATADDPAGTVQHITPLAIRLRGNCLSPGAVTTCHHVAWLDGAFDMTAHEVRITVPLGVTTDWKEGARITPFAAAAIESGVQVGVSEPGITTDTMDQCGVYTIPTGGVADGATGCE